MRKHIHKQLVIYLLFIPFLIISILSPDISVEMTGGFAWVYIYSTMLVGVTLTWIGVFGGEIGVSSKGIKGWIAEFKVHREIQNKEIELLRNELIEASGIYAATLFKIGVFSDRRIKRLLKQRKKTV